MANVDLSKYGITGATEIIHNPSYELLFEEETKASNEGYEVGKESELGAVNVMTGIYTGRSPKDKYIVVDENSKDTVWWTSDEYKNDNHPMSEDVWAKVKDIAKKELCNKRLFVVDAFCGANKDTRMAVRFIVEVAWQAHFVTNMFIKPTAEELENFEPDFVVYNASKAKVENYAELGLNSETCVAFNITSHEQVIINTWYGGEMKKGMFSMMNYYLPLKGIASMHCSANADMNGENTAIFFGLSGTGKTTLSTDPKRLLIGDDEHGWDDNGVFNFEGGCYAKVINLDKDSEPDIYNAIKRNALLENVTLDENGKIAFAVKDIENEETVTISASAAGKTATCVITVKPQIAHYEILDFTKEFGFKMLDRYVGAADVLKAGNYYQWGKNTPVAVAGDVKANANYDANWSADSKGFADWTKPENTPCPIGWGLPDAEQMKAIDKKLEAIGIYEYDPDYTTEEEYEYAKLLHSKMLLAACGQFGHDGMTDIYLPEASYFWSAALNEDGRTAGTFEDNGTPLYKKKNPLTLAFPVRCVKK